MPKCYVGERQYCPEGISECYCEGHHPRDFKTFVEGLSHDIWTNNLCIVDCFEFKDVWVCYPGEKWKCRYPLTIHPLYKKWKDEFSPGELWSFIDDRINPWASE